MGWPSKFAEASWNVAEGAYYAAVGSEMFWVAVSAAMCVLAIIVAGRHELAAYRRAEERASK